MTSMPSSRARNRASGISSCESGKKKILLPDSVGAWRSIASGRASAPLARWPLRNDPRRRRTLRRQRGATRSCLRRRAGRAQRCVWRRALRARERCRRGTAARAGTKCRGPTGRSQPARRIGRNRTGADAQRVEQTRRTDPRRHPRARRPPATRASAFGRLARQRRDERGETCVLALREGRLDPAAGIVQNAHARRMKARLPRRGALEVDLDDFGGAGAHQEQQLDVRPALEQPADDAVEFVVDVGDARQIAFVEDRRREARLGEDHHARGGLNEMGAGARADDQEERVLDLAMQPNDAGQAAEDLALSALAENRRGAASADRRRSGPVRGARERSWRRLHVRARRTGKRSRAQPRRPQLQNELRGVDDIGGVGGQGQNHQGARRRANQTQRPPDRLCAGRARAC